MKAVLGIDVSKAKVDVALSLPEKKVMTASFENAKAGFRHLQRWLVCQTKQPLHACLEATGRYGEALAEYLFGQGHQVSVVNYKVNREVVLMVDVGYTLTVGHFPLPSNQNLRLLQINHRCTELRLCFGFLRLSVVRTMQSLAIDQGSRRC